MGDRYGGRRFEKCPACGDQVEWKERSPVAKCDCGVHLGVVIDRNDRTWRWTELSPEPRRRRTDDPSQLDILGTE